MAGRIQKLSKKEIKEKVDAGWLRVVVLFELVGNPKEHIEKTIRAFLDNIAQDQHIIPLSEDLEETIEVEESKGLFSAAAEVDYLVFGLEKLTWFAFNFMPANIEVKAPEELTFRDKDFSDWINDLLAKLHEVNALHTSLRSEHQELVKNMNIALRNSVLLAVEHEALSASQVAKKCGMGEQSAERFLSALQKEGKVEKEGQKYRRA